MTDTCARCSGQIDRGVRPRSRYCSDRCQIAERDSRPAKLAYDRSPERRARDNERKRAQYHEQHPNARYNRKGGTS